MIHDGAGTPFNKSKYSLLAYMFINILIYYRSNIDTNYWYFVHFESCLAKSIFQCQNSTNPMWYAISMHCTKSSSIKWKILTHSKVVLSNGMRLTVITYIYI